MIRQRLITTDMLLGLCNALGRRSQWTKFPSTNILLDCRRDADDLLGHFPTSIEEVASILFVLSRAEFQLEDAAAELPLAAALAQARTSNVPLSANQQSQLKDL